MLQQTRTPENRYSLSGENAKKYNETSDDIQKCKYSLLIYIIIIESIDDDYSFVLYVLYH